MRLQVRGSPKLRNQRIQVSSYRQGILNDCQLCILQCLKLLNLIANNFLFPVFIKLFNDC